MGKGWILVIVAALAMCMVAGCIGEAVSYTDPEQLIDIGVNEEFVIALGGEDIFKGLRWEANYDATMLDLVDGTHDASGIGRFRFKTLKTGETEVTMVHVHRPEERPAEEPMPTEGIVLLEPKVFNVNIK